MSVVVLLVTTPVEESESVARAVLEPKLAACVNIVPQVRSMYWWEGEIQNDSESILLIKTVAANVMPIRDAIAGVISYEVFELLTVEVTSGNQAYLDWVEATAVLNVTPPG